MDQSQSSESARRTCARLLSVVVALSALCLAGCGGSSPGRNSGPTQGGDFTLSVSPPSLTIEDGTSLPISVSATTSNGFSSPISIQAGNLPAGVTASPSPLTVTPGVPAQLTLTADASTAPASVTVTFTGSSGSLTHSAQLALTTTAAIASNTPPFRTRFVRTNGLTLYYTSPNLHWIIYNPPTSQFFVVDPNSQHVVAIDAATESVAGTLKVPGANAIDDSPDHLTLYVGTELGDIYTIDAAAMKVTHRYPASQFGPGGYLAGTALAMADGRLALLPPDNFGFANSGGYQNFALWNPADNSFSLYAPNNGWCATQTGSCTQVCGTLENIGGFTRTPDRTKLVMTAIGNDGTLCTFDVASGVSNYAPTGMTYLRQVGVAPDGKSIVVPPKIFDSQTLASVGQIDFTQCSTQNGTVFSPDSKTLYATSDTLVCAYDLSSGAQVGWMPNLFVPKEWAMPFANSITPTGPNIQAIDATGLIAGPMVQGVGFLDIAALRTGPVGTQFSNAYPNPATGPAAGGTSTGWTNASSGTAGLAGVYFGSQAAASFSGSAGSITAVAPAGAPGPADIYALTSDGGMQILPDGFSYGPTFLEVTPNFAVAGTGDTLGSVFGYGLGPTNSTSIPPDLQVQIGGQRAQITAFSPNPYGLASPPFPLQMVMYKIPQSTAGSADVVVTTRSGSSTVREGLTYLPSLRSFSLPGAMLAQGVYDSHRDLYYFTDATAVRVFSKTSGAWLPSISIPGAQRLWGLALSADGSKLAIADPLGSAMYVVNPAVPSSVQTIPLPLGLYGNGVPLDVAISDTGVIYFVLMPLTSGADVVYKLDPVSGQLTDYGLTASRGDYNLRLFLSAANSRVYFDSNGELSGIDIATGQVSRALVASELPGDDELALSGDETQVGANSFVFDAHLNAESFPYPNHQEALNVHYVFGEKLSPHGGLSFFPTAMGLMVYDDRVGNLVARVALPIQLSPNYDALVADGTDNILVAITGVNGDGIAVIDLSSIPEPPPLPYETAVRSVARSIARMSGSPPRLDAIPAYQNPRLPFRPMPHVTNRNFLRR